MFEEYDFLISIMDWSFSRLSSFYICPYAWKLIYLDRIKQAENFFSQNGLLVHTILEKYFKKKIKQNELANYYKKSFHKKVKEPAPYNKFVDLKDKYYNQTLEYFLSFNFDVLQYDIIGIEEKIEFEIANKKFIGVIDLLLRDKKDNKLIILDHKSAKIPLTKTGKIAKGQQEKLELFKKQLYLYCKPIIEKYNEYPKELQWNFFRFQSIYTIPFNIDEYNQTLQWAEETIKLIENEILWLPKSEYYWCHNICSCRKSACEYKG